MNTDRRAIFAWAFVALATLVFIPAVLSGESGNPSSPDPVEPVVVEEVPAEDIYPEEPTVGEAVGRTAREKVEEVKNLGKNTWDGPGREAARGAKEFGRDLIRGLRSEPPAEASDTVYPSN